MLFYLCSFLYKDLHGRGSLIKYKEGIGMSEFIQCLAIIAIFLGFIFAIFCGYQIQIKDKDIEVNAKKRNNKKK